MFFFVAGSAWTFILVFLLGPSPITGQLPAVDWSALGNVGLLGSFSGLSLYNSSSDFDAAHFDPSSATLLSVSSTSQSLEPIATTNQGGSINVICLSPDSNQLYIGGSFSSLNSQSGFANIALYHPSTRTFSPLASGLDGPVYAISCDRTDLVWIGGAFARPIGLSDSAFGPNVVSWSPSSLAWRAPPFFGLNGPVWSIEPYESQSGRSIVMAGSFSLLIQSPDASLRTGAISSASTSASLAAQQAGAPANFTSLGSSLAPIPLSRASASAQPSALTTGYSSPENAFCPSDKDGPGTSWQVEAPFDNALFTVNLGQAVQAGGIRLGNSFADGGSTHGFQIVSIPDNSVLQLTFIDPITNQIATCQTNCTLARDFSIPYQDFLFPNGTTLTGFQIVIKSKYGNVAGFHLVQLLSAGNTAYAVNRLNAGSQDACTTGLGSMGGNSSASTHGTWTETSTSANIAGTSKAILISTVPPGTSPTDGPTLTWSVFVPQSGIYEISLYVPGCQSMGDCATRTSVDVIVQPLGAGGASPVTTTVNQTNPQDASSLIYNGTLIASGQGGGVTVTMRLTSTDDANSVILVADQVLLRAHSSNGTTAGILSHGLFEYVLEGTGAFGGGSVDTGLNAASTAAPLKLSTTALDTLGTLLDSGVTVKSVVSDQTVVFVSGDQLSVAGGATGTAVPTTSSIVIANGGLNGDVDTTLILGEYLYAAGKFNATADGTVTNLQGLARWRYKQSATSWEPLGLESGLAGQASRLAVINNMVYVISSGTSSQQPSGRSLAVYDPSKSAWDSAAGGLFVGNLTALSGSKTGQDIYLAGHIIGAASVVAPGGALLSTGSGSRAVPTVASFGFEMNRSATVLQATADGKSVAVAENVPSLSKRWTHQQSSRSCDDCDFPVSSSLHHLSRRQVVSVASLENSTLPYALTSTSGATVLAGAFWKDNQLVLGGRFVTSSAGSAARVVNVGVYNQSSGILRPLNGSAQLTGEVLAIKVINDTAWIGGVLVSPTGKAGLDTYNLTAGSWASTTMPSPQPYANSNVSILAISSRSGGAEVIVAGSFGQLGSLPCQSICLRSMATGQWQSLGNGLRGVVTVVEFTGKTRNLMIAGGSFVFNGTATSHVASWDFASTEPVWLALGDQTSIPGLVRSLVANGEKAVFVGGQAQDGGAAFLMRYDGAVWTSIGGLAAGSRIEHLALVPLKVSGRAPTTSANGIETDRMLMVSGTLVLNNSTGTFGAALWNGATWYPYLETVTESGAPGVVARIISVADSFRSAARRFYSVGIVVLISMAISLGIVFLGVLIGLLIALRMRAKDNVPPQEGYAIGDDDDDEDEMGRGIRARPASLLATIDAATAAMTDRMRHLQRQSGSPNQMMNQPKELAEKEKGAEVLMEDVSPIAPSSHEGRLAAIDPGFQRQTMVDFGVEEDGDEMYDHEDGVGRVGEGEEEDVDQDIDLRRARWSFDPQLPGEIAVGAGESVEVKDRSNPEWWLVRRADGVEGVVPADWFL